MYESPASPQRRSPSSFCSPNRKEGTAAAESAHTAQLETRGDQRPEQSAEGKETKPGTACDATAGARTPLR